MPELLYVACAVLLAGCAALFVLWRNAEKRASEVAEAKTEISNAQTRAAEEAVRAEEARKTRENLQEENRILREKENELSARAAKLETELKNANETMKTMDEIRESMGDKFKSLSEAILEEKGKKFDEQSAKILTPLKDDLTKFRQRVDAIHTADAESRSALKQQIENLQNSAKQYGESADNLALALKGDSKTQGDWGEIVLETLLERSGLREGQEYEAQKTVQGEDGSRLRPDVVINLPDGKHLIVDSKVSLRDFHDASSFEANSQEEKDALDRHVKAVKSHVAELAKKHYTQAKGLNTPDFVFMFMPVEPAFSAALRESPSLFSDAYDKRVILCAPTTLMAILRTVESIWKLERQNRNAEEIALQGKKLYEKFLGFHKNLTNVGSALEKATASYGEAEKQLSSGRGNLIDSANKLLDLGVSTQKTRLPEGE